MPAGEQTALIQLLLTRLERISVDSYWAHRASGVRGALLQLLEELETGQQVEPATAYRLVERGFQILQRAAEEKSK